jgi:hypothetical protein
MYFSDVFWEYLSFIFGAGIVSFILFLLGYAGYSIVKSGKRKRLREQQKYERMETERMENYFRNIDNDLKQEINNAVKEHNRKNGIDISDNKNIDDNDFSKDLTEKIKEIIGKKIAIWLNKIEEKYRIFNEKHNFDVNYEKFNYVKELLNIGINKFADNIGKWEEKEKEYKKWEKWKDYKK